MYRLMPAYSDCICNSLSSGTPYLCLEEQEGVILYSCFPEGRLQPCMIEQRGIYSAALV